MKKDTNKLSSKNQQSTNLYDDGNIPDVDLPQNSDGSVEPLPEYTRPRKDGPGGD